MRQIRRVIQREREGGRIKKTMEDRESEEAVASCNIIPWCLVVCAVTEQN